MSFSSDAKAELCRLPVQKRCCAAAEAYGVLMYCNTFGPNEIRIITSNADFAKRLPRLFHRAFGLSFDSLPDEERESKRSFLITDKNKLETIFRHFGSELSDVLAHHINLAVLESSCCRAAFVRGAFLAGGSISDPDKHYHLELYTSHLSVGRETVSVLLELGFNPLETRRSAGHLIYFKQSDTIADLLTALGAPVSAMGIMSARVNKDMRNLINRKVNCDTANADKTVAAAEIQLSAIKKIDSHMGLSALPENLLSAALLRIANPSLSLADLAALSDPPVTKSCLSHRLKKIISMANEI